MSPFLGFWFMDARASHPRTPPSLLLRLRGGKDALRLRAHPLEVHAQALEDACGDALALTDEAEEQVLRADVGVVQAPRLVDGELDHLLGARSQADLTRRRAVAPTRGRRRRRCRRASADDEESVPVGVDGDGVALTDLAVEHL